MVPPYRRLTDIPDHYELPTDKKIIRQVINKYKFYSPLKLLVPNGTLRRENQLISCAVRPAAFPSQAFIEMKPFVNTGDAVLDNCCILMASPELCFLQAATRLSFFELIKFGYDLCSIYMVDETAEHRQLKRTPAVNTTMLREFLQQLSGINGLSSAKKALNYILDRSNSPMETRLAIIRNLPFSYGGFSIDGQELNADIFLSEEAAAVFKRKKCNVDALWRKEKVVLEYDSNEIHLTAKQHDKDKRKTLALEMDGYKVFPITANMIKTDQDINNTFISLRKMLGRCTDMKRIEETTEKRKLLLKYLRTI